MTRFSTSAAVPTQHASRYLQQLAKHWSHRFAVEFSPDRAAITFPGAARGDAFPGDALVGLEASDNRLGVTITASAPEQLTAVKAAVQSHIDRFAFREAPLTFDWRDGQA